MLDECHLKGKIQKKEKQFSKVLIFNIYDYWMASITPNVMEK